MATERPKLTLVLALVWIIASFALPQRATARAPFERQVGDRAPIFSLATTQDRLMDYDRDYYGKHHLILTFFPAAFTPV